MLAGHYAAAYFAKTAEPRLPLWALFAGAQLVDIAWCVLALAGVERLSLDYSLPTNPLVADYMPYTHSLLANALWAVAAALVAWKWLGSGRAAVILALAVLAHWFFDLPMHRSDLTLAGGEHKLGFALWQYPVLAHSLEFALLGLSVWLYVAWVKPAAPQRKAAIWLGLLLAGLQIYSIVAPPPKTVTEMVASLLVVYLAVAGLAAWLETRSRAAT